MANEKLTFGSVLKDAFTKKDGIKKYLLFTLIILTFGFVTVYLNYTSYYIIGTFILVLILLPIIVTFTEYTALMESGAPFPSSFKSFMKLFQNTYRSGRLRVVLTWKAILGYLLYIVIISFAIVLGFSIFVVIFDKELVAALTPILENVLNAESPEILNALVDEMGALFSAYDTAFSLVNQIAMVAGLIFILNRGIFKVYASVFIEHQPTTKFDVINTKFFKDKETIKIKRRMHASVDALVIIVYGLVFVGSFFLVRAIRANGLNFLQAELIALVVLVIALPFATRFNFYFYQRLMSPKREEVLRFSISELRGILQNPGLPEQGKAYIAEVLKARQQELDELTGVFENVDENTDSSGNIND